jgi:hypothetical protein
MPTGIPKWSLPPAPEQFLRKTECLPGEITIAKKSVDTIGDILAQVFKEEKFDQVMRTCRIFEVWDSAVGARVARHSKPRRLSENILWVTVDNSTWMQELKFLEMKMRDQVNRELGAPMVEKIRFQLGELARPGIETTETAGAPGWQDIDISDSVRKSIEKEVSSIKDEGVRERLKNLFEKQARIEAYRERK